MATNDPVVDSMIAKAEAEALSIEQAQAILDTLMFAAHNKRLVAAPAIDTLDNSRVWIACIVSEDPAEEADHTIIVPLARLIIGKDQVKRFVPDHAKYREPGLH